MKHHKIKTKEHGEEIYKEVNKHLRDNKVIKNMGLKVNSLDLKQFKFLN